MPIKNITDYISGYNFKNNSQYDKVYDYYKKLISIYKYPEKVLKINPKIILEKEINGKRKRVFIDIAILDNSNKNRYYAFIIYDKKEVLNRKKLEFALKLDKFVKFGVIFNDIESLILEKIVNGANKVLFKELSDIPKYREKFEDIGLLKKRDLVKSSDLKEIFNNINLHMYGKLKYTHTDTRARSREIINLLLCKLVDEMQKNDDEYLDFCVKYNESPEITYKRIQDFFNNYVKKKYSSVIDENERISINPDLLCYIVKNLQHISLLKSSKDILSDAFEIFVSKILKDEAGQFFTPHNIVSFMVRYLDPDIGAKILDPACGHGGFLLESKELLWKKIKELYKGNEKLIKKKQIEVISNLYGLDKDLFLARICKLYLEIISGGTANIFCEDSLDFENYRKETKEVIQNEKFDYIFTNPPFGVKIPIDKKDILKNYELGHSWKNIDGYKWKREKRLVNKRPPQVLFIERCVQLLKEGGKLGIVLPEGIFGNPTDRYIWEYLKQNGIILGIVSLSPNAFQPFTCMKTSILFYQKIKNKPKNYKIDFAIVNNVGHDKDGKPLYKLNKDGSYILDEYGNPIINDDLMDLDTKLKNLHDTGLDVERNYFKLTADDIKDNIYIPSYYLGVERALKQFEKTEDFIIISFRDLVKKKIIYTNKQGYLPRGDEIGSKVYGLGDIPFIRTSDIRNWEINLNSTHKTSEEVYQQYKDKQDIRVGDILMVKDGGNNLIGETAFITELDTKILFQSHIYKIRVLKNDEFIDSYLLLFLLNLDVVKKQILNITFSQGTLSTIGNRIMDLRIPLPKSIEKRKEISKYIKELINEKTNIRKKLMNLSLNTFYKCKSNLR
ncbi:MAG: N-6 DNA methylase [Candidatus Helarchaeota archaeon]